MPKNIYVPFMQTDRLEINKKYPLVNDRSIYFFLRWNSISLKQGFINKLR